MGRALWKGAVTFGLVEIPVALQSAAAREDVIEFTLLDRRDFAPVGYERVNKRTKEPVPWPDIVKGYEYEKGEYVAFTEEEIRGANPEASQSIDITDFVDASEIESVFWETPYYLEPTNKKSKSYALLRETLSRSGKVGIAKVVIRTRQRLAALAVRGPAIVLNILRYAHELRDPADLEFPKDSAKALGLTEKEVALAEQLVESMTSKWKPEAYGDDYQKDILALVERKVKAGKTHEVEAAAAPRARKAQGDVLDLMPLLKQSVERTTHVASAAARRAAPKTARARRA